MIKRELLLLFMVLVFSAIPFTQAASLRGTIYNLNLEQEPNVLVEINTVPVQKMLASEGVYSFQLPPGKYVLTARKIEIEITEEIIIPADEAEGEFILDLFLIPDTIDEEDLWKEADEELVEEEPGGMRWQYAIALLIVLWALWRYQKVRRRYGPLRLFRRKIKEESKKSLAQHREELAQEPGYLDKALEIIKKHDGRITQKELRKEMLYLSEAKISLILTELEHKSQIEKIKKGRGNVVILKS